MFHLNRLKCNEVHKSPTKRTNMQHAFVFMSTSVCPVPPIYNPQSETLLILESVEWDQQDGCYHASCNFKELCIFPSQ